MKNEKSIFVNSEEFTATQFFNVDDQNNGIDIYNQEDQYLGSIDNVVLPDPDDENDNIIFDNLVIDWLEENHHI